MSQGQKYHCGPDSWPEWARAFLSVDPVFNDACLLHDKAYMETDKKAADKLFYDAIKEGIGPVWYSPYRRFKAWLYYTGVRTMGSKAFEAAKAKRKKEGAPRPLKIAIIAGHSSTETGAKGKGVFLREWDYTRRQAMDMAIQATERGYFSRAVIRFDGMTIKDAYEKALEIDPDVIIEVHFNAFNNTVKGTEVLHNDLRDRDLLRESVLAAHVLHNLYEVLGRQGIEKRGIKHISQGEGERGFVNVTQTMDRPSILIEPAFGDVASENKLLANKLSEISTACLDAIEEWRAGT